MVAGQRGSGFLDDESYQRNDSGVPSASLAHDVPGANPHFSRPVRNAHRVPTFVGASRESFRPGKLLPKQLATGDLLTN